VTEFAPRSPARLAVTATETPGRGVVTFDRAHADRHAIVGRDSVRIVPSW
jgi:hypothetical protein